MSLGSSYHPTFNGSSGSKRPLSSDDSTTLADSTQHKRPRRSLSLRPDTIDVATQKRSRSSRSTRQSSSNSQTVSSYNEVQNSDDDDDEWDAVAIVGERRTQYSIKWAGIDPKTGKGWPDSWEPKGNATGALLDEWEEWKVKHPGNLRRRKYNDTPIGVAVRPNVRDIRTNNNLDGETVADSQDLFPRSEMVSETRRTTIHQSFLNDSVEEVDVSEVEATHLVVTGSSKQISDESILSTRVDDTATDIELESPILMETSLGAVPPGHNSQQTFGGLSTPDQSPVHSASKPPSDTANYQKHMSLEELSDSQVIPDSQEFSKPADSVSLSQAHSRLITPTLSIDTNSSFKSSVPVGRGIELQDVLDYDHASSKSSKSTNQQSGNNLSTHKSDRGTFHQTSKDVISSSVEEDTTLKTQISFILTQQAEVNAETFVDDHERLAKSKQSSALGARRTLAIASGPRNLLAGDIDPISLIAQRGSISSAKVNNTKYSDECQNMSISPSPVGPSIPSLISPQNFEAPSFVANNSIAKILCQESLQQPIGNSSTSSQSHIEVITPLIEVQLPLFNEALDLYKTCWRGSIETLADISLQDFEKDSRLIRRAENLIKDMLAITLHSERMSGSHTWTQHDDDSAARYYRDSSTKCRFLHALFTSLRDLEKRVAIFVKPGNSTSILKKLLKGMNITIARFGNDTASPHEFSSALVVTLVEGGGKQLTREVYDLVLVIDESTDTRCSAVQQIRQQDGTVPPIVILVVACTADHAYRLLPTTTKPHSRLLGLISRSHSWKVAAGRMISGSLHGLTSPNVLDVYKTASTKEQVDKEISLRIDQLARTLAGAMTKRTESNLSPQSRASQTVQLGTTSILGTHSVSSRSDFRKPSVPAARMASHNSRASTPKRSLDDDANDATLKRPRIANAVDLAPHLRSEDMAGIKSLQPAALSTLPTEQIETRTHASQSAVTAEARDASLFATLESQLEATQSLYEQTHSEIEQYRKAAAKSDYLQHRNTALEEKIKLREAEIKVLELELAASRKALSISESPSAQALNTTEEAKQKIIVLEKRAKSAKEDLEFTMARYREADRAAEERAASITELSKDNDRLNVLANGEAVTLRKLFEANSLKVALNENRRLKAENASLRAHVEKIANDAKHSREECERLKERGGMSFGTRAGSRAGSRQSSPMPLGLPVNAPIRGMVSPLAHSHLRQ